MTSPALSREALEAVKEMTDHLGDIALRVARIAVSDDDADERTRRLQALADELVGYERPEDRTIRAADGSIVREGVSGWTR